MKDVALDPLHQFMVMPVWRLVVAGWDISVTNSALFMMTAVVLVLGFFTWALRKPSCQPGVSQAIAEMPLQFAQQLIQQTNGAEGLVFLPLIASIFLFVFMGNFLGLLPLAFTFTSQLIVNVALAAGVVVVITAYGFYRHGTHFLRLFCPAGVPWWVAPILIPIELISYLSRPISLGIRLFANMVAGHSMLKIFAYFTVTTGLLGVLPWGVNIILMGFELMVAGLQAYVFTMLCCIYLNDALHLH